MARRSKNTHCRLFTKWVRNCSRERPRRFFRGSVLNAFGRRRFRAGENLADGRKAAAMMNRHAMNLKPGIVFRRAISLVVAPIIARMVMMKARHQPVARHFGNDRGSGDGKTAP